MPDANANALPTMRMGIGSEDQLTKKAGVGGRQASFFCLFIYDRHHQFVVVHADSLSFFFTGGHLTFLARKEGNT
jgi:hypothetical protein